MRRLAVAVAVAVLAACSGTETEPTDVVRQAGFVVTPEAELRGAEEEAGIDVFLTFAVALPAGDVDDFLEAGGFTGGIASSPGFLQDEADVEGRRLFRDVAVLRGDADRMVVLVRAYTT